MSVLAHLIEARGFATTVIGLVRPHIENTRCPRALWVPFPLGRPLGEPENPAFQRRVLTQALALLERVDGPVIIEDFADDAPSMRDTEGWSPAVPMPTRPSSLPASPAEWATVIAAEIKSVRSSWEQAQARFGRTTVGLSRLPSDDWANYGSLFLGGEIPGSPISGVSSALLLRYVADDLKAFYSEAVQATGAQPSLAQVNRWFWGETMAADFLRALRTVAVNSTDNGLNTAGGRFLVPAPFVAKA